MKMTRTTELFVDHESGRITLCSPALGLQQPWNVTRTLVSRLLAADCVKSVLLDRSRMTATIQLTETDPSETATRSVAICGLSEIASQLRASSTSDDSISDEYAALERLQLNKSEDGTTAGMIIHSTPGRVRIRHPLIRLHTGLSRIERGLASIPGVKSVTTSSTTGSALVLFDDRRMIGNELLVRLERLLTSDEDQISLLTGPPTSRWVASGTCLGLAIASEFVAPGLSPVTAAALVGFNVPAMVLGIGELASFKWRVASLYTVIMGTTLISGQFLAAALMQASITCWHGWSSRRLRRIAEKLQDRSELPIVLSRSNQSLLVNGQRFPECLIGTVMTAEPGTVLPYDGIVVSGEGELDEYSVRGDHAICRRETGDPVFAGSKLVSGQLDVRVTAVEHQTRVSKVRETLFSAMAELPGSGSPTRRGHESASRFVPLTFATGTAALMIGDLSTLAAVLRPDFATGPSMSERFGTLTSIGHLWDRGWLVKHAEILHELAQTEMVVIFRPQTTTKSKSDHTEMGQPDIHVDPSSQSPRLQTRHVSLSTRSLAIHEIESDEEFCVEFVRELRSENRRVAVVACGNVLNQLADDDVIRISSTPDESLTETSADLIALQSEPREIEELWRILQEARRPHQQGWAAVVGCNALAISGAFLVGFTSLHVVVLTNLGALAAGLLYDRHVRRSSLMLSSSHLSSDAKNVEDWESVSHPPEHRDIESTLRGQTTDPVSGVSFRDSMNARIPPRNSALGQPWQPKKNHDRHVDQTVMTSAGQTPLT